MRAVINVMRQDGECAVEGEGRGRQVRLTAPPDWARQRAADVAGAEAKTKERALRLLRKGQETFLPDLLARLQKRLHKELALPSNGPKEGVAEFAIASRSVAGLIAAEQCQAERVDHPDGFGTVVRLRLTPKAEADPAEKPAANGGQAQPASPGTIALAVIPADRLRPSRWNPNTFSEGEMAELVEEMRRLGRPPKPIVVRRSRKVYEITDGEHSWRAARTCGFAEVPCEIIEADDFEAMRQTITRNRHGTINAVRMGRLLLRMMRERGLSQRALGQEIGLSEATVRNFVGYANAADLRNCCARQPGDGQPVDADELLAGMSVRQIHAYLELPEDRRDEWLDRGGHADEAAAILAAAGKKSGGRNRIPLPESPAAPTEREEPIRLALVGDDDGVEEPAPAAAGSDEHGRQEIAAAGGQVGDESAEPLSQAEREVVDGVLKSYGDARPPVRRKILGGLGAYPDAVAFFSRMIKGGS